MRKNEIFLLRWQYDRLILFFFLQKFIGRFFVQVFSQINVPININFSRKKSQIVEKKNVFIVRQNFMYTFRGEIFFSKNTLSDMCAHKKCKNFVEKQKSKVYS